MKKQKEFSKEIKLKAVMKYLEGNVSWNTLAQEYGCDDYTIGHWVSLYRNFGEEIFSSAQQQNSYASEFKYNVVSEYLQGGVSYADLAIKYKIPSRNTIARWVALYNGHRVLKSYHPNGGITMTKGRPTTYEQRIQIVEECIKNGKDYKATAQKHQVSYNQVYSWVQKYERQGIRALKDNRGKGKDPEDMNQMELLMAENKMLKAKLERMEIEAELKKKIEEAQMRLASATKKKK